MVNKTGVIRCSKAFIMLMIEVIKVWRLVRSNVTFFVQFAYKIKEYQYQTLPIFSKSIWSVQYLHCFHGFNF